jgi:hypothetical protein
MAKGPRETVFYCVIAGISVDLAACDPIQLQLQLQLQLQPN